MNKILLYIAMSKDGFIADVHGGVDWLPQPKTANELEIVGYNALMARIDTICMGSKSFQQIMSFGDWAWPDKHTYVFTADQTMISPHQCISITHDTPTEFMHKMRQHQSNKDIWLLGGAALARSFADVNLIDEIILTIVQQNLRQGILLDLPLQHFNCSEEKQLMDGMVQKFYLRKNL